jgi:RNA-binding protein NOB1
MSDTNDDSGGAWAVVAKRSAPKKAPTATATPTATVVSDAQVASAALLVLDTAALVVPSLPLLGNPRVALCTVQEVLDEVRDRRARLQLAALPAAIAVREPAPEHVLAVVEFAKKTGDFSQLSAVDLKVLALTRHCFVAAHGADAVRSTTAPIRTALYPKATDSAAAASHGATSISVAESAVAAPAAPAPADVKDDDNDDDDDDADTGGADADDNDDEGFVVVRGKGGDAEEDDDDDDYDSDSSDGSEWITKDNLDEIRQKSLYGTPTGDAVTDDGAQVKVACMTSDFAMQNVLVQMGIKIVSPTGMFISHATQWVLRCFACGKLVPDNEKMFCPGCGNHTLKRVAVDFDEQTGEQRVLISRRPLNVRGTRHPLPMPRGGHSDKGNIILSESELILRANNRSRRRGRKVKAEYDFGELSKPTVRREGIVIGLGKKNPNQARKSIGKSNRSVNRLTEVGF